jgi:hypothetical protein
VSNPHASDIKVFVPAKDFIKSREFYVVLGWKVNWEHKGLAELELADCRFYLQDFYVKEWAENFMLYVAVDDAQQWYEHVAIALRENVFDGTRVKPPKEESYGAIVTYVWDPSGVLLHLAQKT